ncbi:MAG: ABC transporter substrate-binding protein [Syntrophorhabdales bacterium]
MNSKTILAVMAGLMLMLFCTPFLPGAAGETKDLTASLALIPGLIDSPDKGPFVDVVKAIGGVYTGGKIKIETYPFARSVQNVVQGKADFHIPTLRNRAISEAGLPYRFTTEKIGTVCFVIYSNTEKPLTKKMLANAIAQKGKFPYTIEVPAGLEAIFGFPVGSSNDVASSLQKVQKKRIDALVWAQEEVDHALKELKISTIRREHWMDYDDSIIIAKGPRGDAVDAILSSALRKLRASGQLQALYSKVHRPYNDWQPSTMGW